MKIQNKTIKIFTGILIAILIAVGIFFSMPVLKKVFKFGLSIIIPFAVAYIFALVINPLMKKLCTKLKIPRTAAAIFIIVVILGGLGSIIFWLVLKIINELREVYQEIIFNREAIIMTIENIKDSFQGFYDAMPPQIQTTMLSLGDSLYATLDKFINQNSVPIVHGAGNIAKSLPKILITIIVFILALFFMISDFETVNNAVKKPFSNKTKRKFILLSHQIKVYLGGYVKAQAIIMSVVFIVLSIGLTVINIPYAMLIALGIALLDALPIFGSGAVLWPWSIIGFISGNLRIGFGMIVMYVIIMVVRQSIEPKIVSKNIGMNPILTLISMYTGFKAIGIGGMILGPITLIIIFSLYKATVFDTPITLIKAYNKHVIKKYRDTKKRLIKFWESE